MKYSFILVFIPLTAILLFESVVSLEWRMIHDTPLLHYAAFLIDRFDYVPYKDVFETSTPGTLLFHLSIGKIFGYGDLAFRCVDICLLSILSGLTWGIMKPFDRRVAWASVVLFDLSYLWHGATMSLQRDYIGILPIAAALFLTTRVSGNSGFLTTEETENSQHLWKHPRLLCVKKKLHTHNAKAFFIGILFGVSATIKPHLSIGLPLMIWQIENGNSNFKFQISNFKFQNLISAFFGFILPIAAALLWVWAQGGLSCFLEMFSSYLPLHLFLTGSHRTISGAERLFYLARAYITFGGLSFWLIPAFAGFYIAFFKAGLSPKKKRTAILLAVLVIAYSIYPVFAGQFWPYHWMPFQYFIVLSASLVFIPFPSPSRFYPVMLFIFSVILACHTAPDIRRQIKERNLSVLQYGHDDDIAAFLRQRVTYTDEITAFLKLHLKEKDKVQPLDWTGGAIHAMLRAEVPIATPYIHDYHFYHHISNPHIQRLRKRFIQKLQDERPRFIIDMPGKSRVSGEDTTDDFQELWEFIHNNYRIMINTNGYVIYEKT